MTLAHRADRAQADLAGVAGRGLGDDPASPTRALIDEDQVDGDLATTTEVNALYTPDQLKFVHATGVDGDPGPADMTVTGLAANDVLLAVFGGDAIPLALASFTVAAGKLVVTGLDLGVFDYCVVFIDVSA